MQQATSLTLKNAVLPGGVGQEAKVVGNAFVLAANKISAPIEGNTGVYVVKNVSTIKAPALKAMPICYKNKKHKQVVIVIELFHH